MMCISLFTSRVILQTLGVEDYGIYNVVAGVVILFTFIDDGMYTSTLRFITYEQGTGDKKMMHEAFVTSMHIHCLTSVVIVLLAETVGLWFMQNRLIIPPERMTAAFWCYQLTIFLTVVNNISHPYEASLVAHEKMSAFAFISIVDAVLKLLLVYSLLAFSYDRLILYSILFVCEKLLIRSIYNIYCTRHFEECYYQLIYNKVLFREMFSFAFWNMWGNMAYVVSSQGLNILLNMFFGPVANAARAVAMQAKEAVNRFVKNFQTAINPQITKAYASSQIDVTHTLIFRSSRFSFFLLLILCLPIIVETPAILSLWLGQVPDNAVAFLRILLLIQLVQQSANPLSTAVAATGQVKKCEFVIGSLMLVIVPLAYLALRLGWPAWTAYAVHLFIAVVAFVVRLFIVMPLIELRMSDYWCCVVKRCAAVMALSVVSAFALKQLVDGGIWLSVAVAVCTIIITSLFAFAFGLEASERAVVVKKIQSCSHRFQK